MLKIPFLFATRHSEIVLLKSETETTKSEFKLKPLLNYNIPMPINSLGSEDKNLRSTTLPILLSQKIKKSSSLPKESRKAIAGIPNWMVTSAI